MNKLNFSHQIALAITAIFVLFVGNKLHSAILIVLGLIIFGILLIINGIQTINKKRLGFETTRPNFGRREIYTGISAQLWGILFIIYAIELMIISIIIGFHFNNFQQYIFGVLDNLWIWGIIILNIGLTAFIAGITRLISGSAGYYKGTADFMIRIGGGVPFIFGIIILMIGITFIVSPKLIHSTFDSILKYFQK